MRILALDLSTSTGYAVFDGGALVRFGSIQLEKTILEYGKYPFCYYLAADDMTSRIWTLIIETNPDKIVVEETNMGKSRYSQKSLEFLHCLIVRKLHSRVTHGAEVVYLDSSAWRKALGLVLTKEQKNANAKLAKAKREALATGGKLDKSALGVKGKVGKKHVAIAYVNERFKMTLRMKDDDIADAIALGAGFLAGASICDGT